MPKLLKFPMWNPLLRCNFAKGVFLLFSLLLHGCLTSTLQHSNTGRILEPGVTESRWGLAGTRIYICNNTTERPAGGNAICKQSEEGDAYNGMDFYTVATNWRLGVRKEWGSLTGVDLGWAIEGPGTLEFDTRLGLPGTDGTWDHALAVGWGVGNWADNTWYLEYGASALLMRLRIWANYRFSWVATGVLDLEFDTQIDDENTEPLISHKRFLHQWGSGLKLQIPKYRLLPRYIDIGYHISTPILLITGSTPENPKENPAIGQAWSVGLTWE